MSSPHHLRVLAGCNNRTSASRAVALRQRSQSSASLRGSGSAEAMVSAVEGLPEDVMPVQQIEQAVYARVIAHKPGSKSRQNPPRCFARPKEFPLDPYTISEHRGGGLAGGIYLDLARGQMRRAQAVASGPLGCRPHEFCPSCEPRSKRTANSRSTLATAHPRRARRRDTRAAAARLLLPVHKPRPSSCGTPSR